MEQQPDVGDEKEEEDDEEEDDDDSSVTAKKAAKDYAACRGLEWLYAVLKRMEDLHARDIVRWKAEHDALSSRHRPAEASGAASSRTESVRGRRVIRRKRVRMGRAEPHPKLFHLFPTVGNVPGNIMVTEQLLMCMMRDMKYTLKCKQKLEVEAQKAAHKERVSYIRKHGDAEEKAAMKIEEQERKTREKNVKDMEKKIKQGSKRTRSPSPLAACVSAAAAAETPISHVAMDVDDAAATDTTATTITAERLHAHSWLDMMTRNDLQWWKCTNLPVDKGRIRLRNKFMTDGVSVSVLETCIRVKTKVKPPEPVYDASGALVAPPRRVRIDASDYITAETVESLHTSSISAIGAFDLNRKNYMVCKVRLSADIVRSQSKTVGQRNGRPPGLPPDATETEEELRSRKLDARHKRRRESESVTIRISKREYQHVRRTKHHTRARQVVEDAERARARTAGDVDIFQAPPSFKGTRVENMHAYLMYMCQDNRFDACLKFYARQKFRWLRMQSYSAGQHWWVYVQDKIYRVLRTAGLKARKMDPTCSRAQLALLENPRKTKNMDPKAPRLCIALGDGSFRHNSVGHITMPTGARMFREMRRLGEHIRWVDEFRTSKCCAKCHEDLQPAFLLRSHPQPRTNLTRIAKATAGLAQKQARQGMPHDPSFPFAHAPRDEKFHSPLPKRAVDARLARCPKGGVESVMVSDHDDETLRAPWGLKVCTSAACTTTDGNNRLVCRDVNADDNMLMRIRWHLLGEPDRLRIGTDNNKGAERVSVASPAIQANLNGQ